MPLILPHAREARSKDGGWVKHSNHPKHVGAVRVSHSFIVVVSDGGEGVRWWHRKKSEAAAPGAYCTIAPVPARLFIMMRVEEGRACVCGGGGGDHPCRGAPDPENSLPLGGC